jgi:hypothetical protein
MVQFILVQLILHRAWCITDVYRVTIDTRTQLSMKLVKIPLTLHHFSFMSRGPDMKHRLITRYIHLSQYSIRITFYSWMKKKYP